MTTTSTRRKKYDGFESKDDSAAFRWLVEQESRLPGAWYTQEEVEWGADMSRACANRHLRGLVDAGNVSRKSEGNRHYYRVAPVSRNA